MEERRSKRRLMSLAQCSKALRQPTAMGDQAPALVTLKRWKSVGKLRSATVARPDGQKRPFFDLDEVLRICLAARQEHPAPSPSAARVHIVQSPPPERLPQPHVVQALPAAEPGAPAWPTAAVPGPDGVALMALLTQMCATMDEIKVSLDTKFRTIDGGLGNLNATRVSLMTKYDAQNQGFRDRIELLERENETLRKSGSVVDISKLNSLLSRVNDQLAGISARQS